MPQKKLRLNRQTLRELTPEELNRAAGGELTPNVGTMPVDQCVALTLPTNCAECIPLT